MEWNEVEKNIETFHSHLEHEKYKQDSVGNINLETDLSLYITNCWLGEYGFTFPFIKTSPNFSLEC